MRQLLLYLSLLECSLAISLRFCLSHSRRALSCSSLCLFLLSCSLSFSFTLACFPWTNRKQSVSGTAPNVHQNKTSTGWLMGTYKLCCFLKRKIVFWKGGLEISKSVRSCMSTCVKIKSGCCWQEDNWNVSRKIFFLWQVQRSEAFHSVKSERILSGFKEWKWPQCPCPKVISVLSTTFTPLSLPWGHK